MPPPPRVSVVLPVFNAEPYLGDAVESLLGQTLRDFELIVIDDGSTDGSRGILEGFAARDNRVRLVVRENRGLAATLNEGIQRTGADSVAIMNADDVALPERLAKQADFLDAYPGIAAVGSQIRLMRHDGRLGPTTSLPTSPAQVCTFLRKASPLAHPVVMFRRQAVLAVGGYRPQMEPAEDYDLWLRLAEHHDLANLPDVLLYYRLHACQATAQGFEAVGIATLTAQASARARHTGVQDPVETQDRINLYFAESLGIPAEAIAGLAIEAALTRGESLLTAGASAAAAMQPLESLAGHPLAVLRPGLYTAACRWLAGRSLLKEGRFSAGWPQIIAAAVSEPYFRRRMFYAAARRGRPSLFHVSAAVG